MHLTVGQSACSVVPMTQTMTVDEYWSLVNETYRERDSWRYGQSAFNVLAQHRPDIAEPIRGSMTLDPFYAVDRFEKRVVAFAEYVERKW